MYKIRSNNLIFIILVTAAHVRQNFVKVKFAFWEKMIS